MKFLAHRYVATTLLHAFFIEKKKSMPCENPNPWVKHTKHDTFSYKMYKSPCVFLTFLHYGKGNSIERMHTEDFLSKSNANKVDTTSFMNGTQLEENILRVVLHKKMS